MRVCEGSTVDMRLTSVLLPLPHNQLVLNTKARESAPEIEHLLFMPDMGLWFADHALNRAPNATDVWQGSGYHFATERRTINRRGYGSVGGWIKNTTHVKFFFLDKQTAMLFKLTWGGSC